MIKDRRLVIIFLTVFIDLVGFGIIIPMNPYLAERFGATPLEIGLLMSVYSLMQFIFSPLWGQLSDRIGRRPVILWSLFGAACAHMGFAFAETFWGLVIARLLAGVFGGNLGAAMAYIADITSAKDRSKGMGMIGAAFGLGFILGPSLGGVFADLGSRWGSVPPFGQSFPAVVASVICFGNFLFAWRALPETNTRQARAHGLRFQKMFRAMRHPLLGTLLFLLFLNTFALAHIEASLFLYVQQKFNWTLSQASYGFAYIGIIMVITQGYLIRKLMPKLGEKRVLIAGLGLAGLGYAIASFATGVPVLALGVTFLGFGYGMANPSLTGSVSLASSAEEQGENLGVGQSLASLARILGPPTGGFLYQAFNPSAPFGAAAIVALCGCVLAYAIRTRMPEGARKVKEG